ncbi:MAG TPA: hypothetical protein VJT15_18945 [Pyrinomonadaceae bacterium]|nr:hypothetical protein [Pyrinomonadaceae bacterium]
MNPATRNTLAGFPKQRLPLPPKFAAIYSEHCNTNRNGSSAASGLSQKMESWMHRKVAADVKGGEPKSTLEIGAGTLNHLVYEPSSAPYDIVEPTRARYRHSPAQHRVRKIYEDVGDVPATNYYDRIISIATFEHICNLPEVIARCGLLLSSDGQLRVAIPSEGTPLWRLGWQMTTGLEFRLKYKLDYGVMMKHEHVNTAAEIKNVLQHFFARVECAVFGINQSFSFYQFYACANPDRRLCTEFLEG